MVHTEVSGGRGRGSDRGKGAQVHVVTSGRHKGTQSSPGTSGKRIESSPGGGSRVHSSHASSVIGVPRGNVRVIDVLRENNVPRGNERGSDSGHSAGRSPAGDYRSHSHSLQPIPNLQGYDSYGEDDDDAENGDDHTDDDMMGRGSNVAQTPPTHPSHREFIERAGSGFKNPAVHRQITLILRMFYTSLWLTWRDIHKTGLEHMFNRFKTLYQWPDPEEAKMYEGFLNVLKNNFRELMRTARKRAAKLARGAGATSKRT